MSVIDRLLGRRSSDPDRHQAQATPREEAPHCAHLAMTPRWDRIEDMGHEDRASSFVCDSCHQMLTQAEA